MANYIRSLILAAFLLLFVSLPAVFAEENNTLIPTHQLQWPVNHCADCGHKVDRADAGAASNAACRYWWQTMIYQDGFGTDGVGYM